MLLFRRSMLLKDDLLISCKYKYTYGNRTPKTSRRERKEGERKRSLYLCVRSENDFYRTFYSFFSSKLVCAERSIDAFRSIIPTDFLRKNMRILR